MRVIIVDDERAAIDNLREVIDEFEELDVLVEISDGRTAIDEIRHLQPDLVFLDIEMPEVDGFKVAETTADIDYQLVFVTAYDQYALDAFGTNAVDYLLKPVRPNVLKRCINKILRREEVLLAALTKSESNPQHITLSDSGGLRVLRHAEITYIEGIGRYRRIHLTAEGRKTHATDTILSDTTLDDFDTQLSDAGFIRLHRGYIVRVDGVRRLLSESRRHYVLLDESDLKIPVSRGKVGAVRTYLKSNGV